MATTVILFLGSNPGSTTRLSLTREVQAIDDRLRSTDHRDRFELHQQWEPEAKNLPELFMRFKPNIVHFGGHAEEAEGLVFHADSGGAMIADPRAIAEVFRLAPPNSIRCVVLSACYSKQQAEEIAKYVPVVIGAEGAVADDAAREFAEGFYSAIGYGRNLRDAFDIASVRMSLARATPVGAGPVLIAADGVDPAAIVFVDASARPRQSGTRVKVVASQIGRHGVVKGIEGVALTGDRSGYDVEVEATDVDGRVVGVSSTPGNDSE